MLFRNYLECLQNSIEDVWLGLHLALLAEDPPAMDDADQIGVQLGHLGVELEQGRNGKEVAPWLQHPLVALLHDWQIEVREDLKCRQKKLRIIS